MEKLMAEQEAAGKVNEIFDDIKANFGMVPNFFRATPFLSFAIPAIILHSRAPLKSYD
jgi:hypothetical protein